MILGTYLPKIRSAKGINETDCGDTINNDCKNAVRIEFKEGREISVTIVTQAHKNFFRWHLNNAAVGKSPSAPTSLLMPCVANAAQAWAPHD